ncbi:uncharacterized protein PAC_05660 [Phialocephala subalpina]|uniref:Erythromycin biosynthesis protein CIII-like C-terminal domain-containing protein n=1 Tax=Phialocephala subalpina TaxID=576137 RepID=A0A1L7WSM5_9HELO|nr:uncharacterized protein PAC_05660 [Phialocephala subalpina]
MPATGHINIFQPAAHELVKHSHTVYWLTGPAYESSVIATGATFIPFSPACMGAFLPALSTDQTRHGTGLSAAIATLIEIFVSPVPHVIDQYQEILKDFKADILLVDLCSLPALVLRELGGPRYATLSVNPFVTLVPEIPPWGSSHFPATTWLGKMLNWIQHLIANWLVLSKVNDALNIERAKLGLSEPLRGIDAYPKCSISRDLHMVPTTMAFEFPRKGVGEHVKFVGPLMPLMGEGWKRPKWWREVVNAEEEGLNIVHVTQGTFATASQNLIKPTIEALAGEDDVLLVVTTPDAEKLNEQMKIPQNVRIEKWLPHQELLKNVKVMITNGGYGGVLTALSFGVPLVGAGLTEDKAMVNSRIAWSGAGIDLKTNTPGSRKIREAVRKVLDNPKYKRVAMRIQEDFAKHNGAETVCESLEHCANNQ